MNVRYLRFGLLGAFIGLIGLLVLASYFKYSPKTYTQDVPTALPDLGGAFRLVDQFGKVRTNQEFQGKYMLIYFGYSFCPDVCPLGLQNITGALKDLGKDVDQIIPIFITVDPERDDVKSLSLYAQNWHSSFVMLTGSQQQLDPVIKAFKVYAVKSKPQGTEADYLIDHSALVYLMDRQGKFIDFFPHTTPPAQIAQKIRKHLLNEFQST